MIQEIVYYPALIAIIQERQIRVSCLNSLISTRIINRLMLNLIYLLKYTSSKTTRWK